MFIQVQGTRFIILLIYVNGILIASNDMPSVHSNKDLLHHKFRIKDLGPPKYFLGLEIPHFSKGIFLRQRKYVLDIIADSGILNSKPAKIPLE